MKKLIICFLLPVFLFSCEKEEWVYQESIPEAACGVSDPLQDLGWLKTRIDEASVPDESGYCRIQILTQGNYKGETVFIPTLGGALCCTCGNAVYSCEGEVVFSCNQEEENKITDKRVIWKSN